MGGFSSARTEQHLLFATDQNKLYEIWGPDLQWAAKSKGYSYGDPGGGNLLDENERSIVAVAGYSDSNDHLHVFEALDNGRVNEVRLPGRTIRLVSAGEELRVYESSVLGLAAFSGVDRYHHVVVATSDGLVHDLWFALDDPNDSGEDVIGSFPNLLTITGYACSRDASNHVIVATKDGDIHDIWYPGLGGGIFNDVRAHIEGVVSLAAFVGTDNYQHIVVATKDGKVRDIWFSGFGWGGGRGQAIRAIFPAEVREAAIRDPTTGRKVGSDSVRYDHVRSIAAYSVWGDQSAHIVVATDLDRAVHQIVWQS
jgi:hypothetical protein